MRCLTLILLLISGAAAAQWNAQKLADFPGPARDDAVATYYKGKIFAGFGLNEFFSYENDWWVYDTSENTWQQLPNSPMEPRQYLRTFRIGQHLYLFGGTDGSVAFDDFWRFNLETQVWKELPKPPLLARWAGVGFALNGQGYLGLGNNFDSTFKDLWQYNPASTSWQRRASLPAAGRSKCIGLAVGYKALIAGGLTETDSGFALHADMWQYNPLHDQWEESNDPLPVASAYHYAAFNGSQVFILGGFTRKNGHDSILPNRYTYGMLEGLLEINGLGELPFGRGGNLVSDEQGNFYALWGLNENFQRINQLYRISASKSNDSKQQTQLFPNPTVNGRAWLVRKGLETLRVFDMRGQQALEQELNSEETFHMIDLSALSSGDYILRLEFLGGGGETIRLRRD